MALRFCFTGLARISAPLTTLRRLAAFERLGRMPRYLLPAEQRADRWTLALRAHDAKAHGASQREVAEALFGIATARRDWDAASDHLRSKIRRLLRLGASMTAGGWRTLIAPASIAAAAAKDGEEKTGAPREGQAVGSKTSGGPLRKPARLCCLLSDSPCQIVAIRSACKTLEAPFLDGCILYLRPEPSPCACQPFTGRGFRLPSSQRTDTLRRAPGSLPAILCTSLHISKSVS
ncbi:DUF2285 domain-containing protein [Stakelama pacifica]|uniref:Uncharacterized protein DUF2285 n=1 Tax=Stakelama pacifica TaxID=517720 RepID=A0A4V3BUC9_9SPHN|nr:uncharacterized protein DUF2285 [Stakelama pacifica]